MNISSDNPDTSGPNRRFGCLHVTIFLRAAIVITAGITFWLVRVYVFPSEFKPVTLNEKEEQILNAKLDRLDPTIPKKSQS